MSCNATLLLLMILIHPLLQLRPREKEAFEYGEKLKEKFAHHPQVKRISRHRHVPKAIHHAASEMREIRQSHKRKYVFGSLVFRYITGAHMFLQN